MKNSNDTIGNRTRDLLTCNAVPQPTALRRSLIKRKGVQISNVLGSIRNVVLSRHEIRHARI